jgi:hypothetical protein
MFRKFIDFLGSLRFTIVLIVALGGIFLLGLWVPQKGMIDSEYYLGWQARSPQLVGILDLLGFTSIYTAPVTLGLWLLFFLNLSIVTWRRIPVVRRRVTFVPSRLADPQEAPGYPVKRTHVLPPGMTPREVSAFFARAGFRMHGSAGLFYGVRNRLSPVASLLFHLSFFLILLGGVVSIYTRFSGQVDLAEGESFQGEIDRYGQRPHLPRFGAPPRQFVEVQKITPVVVGEMPTGLTVRLRDAAGTVHVVDINKPYKNEHTSFVIKDLGVAPLFVIRDRDGKEVDGAFSKLNVLKGREDGFQLGGYRFRARFFPDYAEKDGKPQTNSEEFRNPAFRLALMGNGAVGEERTIRPGETMDLGDRRLELREMRFWVRFMVIKEYGLEILYAGFALAAIGLVWRLIFYTRELLGAVVEENDSLTLRLAYRGELYRTLAEDECDALLERLDSSWPGKAGSP